MSQRRFAGKNFVDALLMLPMVLPPTVLGYYLIVVIGRNGVLGQYLDRWFGINLMFTWQGAVIAASLVSLPLIYKAARAAFEDVDGRFLHAARTLGAGEAEIFLRIALRVGLSTVVNVDLHDQSGPVLAQQAPQKASFTTNVYDRQLAEADAMITQLIHDNSLAAPKAVQR